MSKRERVIWVYDESGGRLKGIVITIEATINLSWGIFSIIVLVSIQPISINIQFCKISSIESYSPSLLLMDKRCHGRWRIHDIVNWLLSRKYEPVKLFICLTVDIPSIVVYIGKHRRKTLRMYVIFVHTRYRKTMSIDNDSKVTTCHSFASIYSDGISMNDEEFLIGGQYCEYHECLGRVFVCAKLESRGISRKM